MSDEFFGFGKEVENVRYDKVELRKYFDRVQKEVIMCYYGDPFSCDGFLNTEYCFSGRDFREGTWRHVSLLESIRYDDKMGDNLYGPFYDSVWFVKLENIKM